MCVCVCVLKKDGNHPTTHSVFPYYWDSSLHPLLLGLHHQTPYYWDSITTSLITETPHDIPYYWDSITTHSVLPNYWDSISCTVSVSACVCVCVCVCVYWEKDRTQSTTHSLVYHTLFSLPHTL